MIILGAGTVVAAIVTGLLFLIFRRFGGKSHIALMAVLVGFIFACCLVLFLVAHE